VLLRRPPVPGFDHEREIPPAVAPVTVSDVGAAGTDAVTPTTQVESGDGPVPFHACTSTAYWLLVVSPVIV